MHLKVWTTNDVEGWHNRLHVYAGQKFSFNGINLYLLLDVFHAEAIKVDKKSHQFQQGKKIRKPRKTLKILNAKLFTLWDQHTTSKVTTEKLLTECAEMYTSSNTTKDGPTDDDYREVELE
jgi:hypothetical protein